MKDQQKANKRPTEDQQKTDRKPTEDQQKTDRKPTEDLYTDIISMLTLLHL